MHAGIITVIVSQSIKATTVLVPAMPLIYDDDGNLVLVASDGARMGSDLRADAPATPEAADDNLSDAHAQSGEQHVQPDHQSLWLARGFEPDLVSFLVECGARDDEVTADAPLTLSDAAAA